MRGIARSDLEGPQPDWVLAMRREIATELVQEFLDDCKEALRERATAELRIWSEALREAV
jgi:hypothetical protein